MKWKNLDDEKQNTHEPFSKLREMEVERLVKALDERLASSSGASRETADVFSSASSKLLAGRMQNVY